MPAHSPLAIFLEPLERLGLPYYVTGSVAASVYGEPRLTSTSISCCCCGRYFPIPTIRLEINTAPVFERPYMQRVARGDVDVVILRKLVTCARAARTSTSAISASSWQQRPSIARFWRQTLRALACRPSGGSPAQCAGLFRAALPVKSGSLGWRAVAIASHQLCLGG